MKLELDGDALDEFAPFAILCASDELEIERIGPALRKCLGRDLAGVELFDAFTVDRPRVADAAALIANADTTVLLRSQKAGLTLRCQLVHVADGRILLLGSPSLSNEDNLTHLGLRYTDFAYWDPTPDVLILKSSQEQSMRDLAELNSELSLNSDRLRRANSAIGEAERRYRELVEHQPLVTYIDGIGYLCEVQFISDNIFDLTGYPTEQWYAIPDLWWSVLHPDDRDEAYAEHRRTTDTGEPYKAEFRFVRADKSIVWIQASDRVVHDDEGNALYRLGYMLDVTETRVVAERLREARDQLGRLVASMHAGVLVEDNERRVAITNQAFCAMFSIPTPPDALIGSDCSAAADQTKHLMKDPDAFVRRIDEIIAANTDVLSEEIEFADGRVYERDYIPLATGEHGHGRMWSYRDVTPRIEAQRSIEQAHAEAVAASETKSQFLATVSHEIRTPMHGVLGAIDILQGTKLDSEQRTLAGIVRRSASSLLDIINDMLDLQRAESGQMNLTEERLDAATLIAEVIDTVGTAIEAKGIELISSIDGVPRDLLGDPGRLRQILLNLVGNSIKFTDAGFVSLKASGLDVDEDAATVRFTVRDSGVGIAAEDQETIFEPFTQGDTSNSRLYEGSGLGLAITRRLVDLMGGKIELSSEPGSGTTVSVELRLRRGELDTPDRLVGGRPLRLSGRVLVVEDSELNRELALHQLVALGLEATAVGSGEAALKALEAANFDVVLMDLRMPGFDGLQTTAAIREREGAERLSRVPIIAFTANAMPSDRDACVAAGMDDFVSKPLLLEELADSLARWLPELRDAPAPPAGPEAPSNSGSADPVHRKLDFLTEDLGGPGAVERLVATWLAELPGRLDAARDAAARGDAHALGETAHTLKSTCAIIGADDTAALAAQIETAARNDGTVDAAGAADLERSASAVAESVRSWRAPEHG